MATKLTNEEILERFSKLYNGEYQLISEYTNNSSEAKILHKNCGTVFTVSRLTRFFNLSNACPCPKCREHATGKRLNLDSYSEKVKEKYGNKYKVLSFTKMHDKVTLKCTNCGNTFEVIANTLFLNNRFSGCPNCRENKRGKHASDPNYLENALKERADRK